MKRFELLQFLASSIGEDVVTVTSLTGTAKEWAVLRQNGANFYGLNMGLCTPFATGLALALPHRKIIALETDGSLLLTLGSLATLANQNPKNLVEIVFDNGCYQVCNEIPSATSGVTDLEAVARGAGIKDSSTIHTLDEFKRVMRKALDRDALTFVVAKIEPKTADVENRYITLSGRQIKEDFVRTIHRLDAPARK